MSKSVVIAGAGLVGSLWAYILKKRGFEVEVFEKRVDPKNLESPAGRSINLVITSRGLRGLEVAGLLQKIIPITVPVDGREIHSKTGETFFQPYGRDKSDCNYSVSRWDLNKALIQACLEIGVKIHFEHGIKNVDPLQKILTIQSPEGDLHKNYELLFATDGAGSEVRQSLIRKFPELYKESVDWLATDYKELHLPKSLNGLPALKKNALHIWPRGTHMMMGLANADDSFTMTLYLPKENHPYAFDHLKSEEDVLKLFKSEFNDTTNLIPDYQKNFLKNPQGKLATVKLSRWIFEDSIALMGDSAHAIVPFFGQGMNLGFEDCTTLLNCFEQNQNNWAQALQQYNQVQIPNANAIAEMALENFVEMRDKVQDARFQLKKKIETVLEKSFPEMYRSRYGLITYTLTPYSLAQQVGVKQNDFLDAISKNIQKPEDVDLNLANKLLEKEFHPWMKSLGIKTESYQPKISVKH